jgi:phosphoribosylformylglycinamidine (FGAM) synthase-like enzyme
VRHLIATGAVSAAHDIADGGMLIAVAEMALAGNLGAELTFPPGIEAHEYAFGEDQGRYLVTTADPASVIAEAQKRQVPVTRLGIVGGVALTVNGGDATSLAGLRTAHEGWLPSYMDAARAAAE